MAFLLTSISGLSTLLGSIFIFIKFKNEKNIINIALSFAAGVMITVSIFDLIPESYMMFGNNSFSSLIHVLISINIGIIISMLIDKFVPGTDDLYKVGVVSMLAIILHNIPEGIATFLSCTKDQELGIYLTLAIALHNIPEGISISLPIYYATKNKKKALFYTFISGISELLGAIIANIFLKNYINDSIMAILLGIIGGIMIHIASYELLPKSFKYKKYRLTFLSILVGCFIMFLSHLLIK